MRRWLVPFVVVVLAAMLGSLVVVVAFGGDEAAAAVVLEPVNSTGTDPFTDSVAINETADFPDSVNAVSAGLETDADTGGLAAPASTPGLYGGTQDESVCDPDQLVQFLDDNPDKAAAWADVLGIQRKDIEDYIAGLTPVVLTTDTRVTNHGYKNGKATTFQSVLQAGTAVLVDDRGVPRVKCGCGNPLTDPATDTSIPTGSPWPGYRPDQVATVIPAPKPLTDLTLTDITTGDTYEQPIATGGSGRGGGAGEWVAVVGDEIQASQDDGKTWSVIGSTEQSESTWISAVAYGDGQWVAVGGERNSESDAEGDLLGAIFVSEDARSWRQVVTVPHQLGSVAYGDGKWMALGSWETVGWFYTSTDGTSWTEVATVTPTQIHRFSPGDIAFGDGTWVALAYEESQCGSTICTRKTLMTSPDAITWTITETHFKTVATIAYGEGEWLVADSEYSSDMLPEPARISSSGDLTSWSVESPDATPGRGFPTIAFGDGTWLLAVFDPPSSEGTLFSSTDGRTWVTAGTVGNARSLARRSS